MAKSWRDALGDDRNMETRSRASPVHTGGITKPKDALGDDRNLATRSRASHVHTGGITKPNPAGEADVHTGGITKPNPAVEAGQDPLFLADPWSKNVGRSGTLSEVKRNNVEPQSAKIGDVRQSGNMKQIGNDTQIGNVEAEKTEEVNWWSRSQKENVEISKGWQQHDERTHWPDQRSSSSPSSESMGYAEARTNGTGVTGAGVGRMLSSALSAAHRGNGSVDRPATEVSPAHPANVAPDADPKSSPLPLSQAEPDMIQKLKIFLLLKPELIEARKEMYRSCVENGTLFGGMVLKTGAVETAIRSAEQEIREALTPHSSKADDAHHGSAETNWRPVSSKVDDAHHCRAETNWGPAWGGSPREAVSQNADEAGMTWQGKESSWWTGQESWAKDGSAATEWNSDVATTSWDANDRGVSRWSAASSAAVASAEEPSRPDDSSSPSAKDRSAVTEWNADVAKTSWDANDRGVSRWCAASSTAVASAEEPSRPDDSSSPSAGRLSSVAGVDSEPDISKMLSFLRQHADPERAKKTIMHPRSGVDPNVAKAAIERFERATSPVRKLKAFQ